MLRAISDLSIRAFTLFHTQWWSVDSFVPFRIAVHPSGKSYASGGEDGFVRVHHFDESYFKAKPYGDMEIED